VKISSIYTYLFLNNNKLTKSNVKIGLAKNAFGFTLTFFFFHTNKSTENYLLLISKTPTKLFFKPEKLLKLKIEEYLFLTTSKDSDRNKNHTHIILEPYIHRSTWNLKQYST